MKELFTVLARYNRFANGKLIGYLEAAPGNLITAESRTWFGSILGTLNHVLISDLGWLNRFKTLSPAPGALDDRSLAFERPPAGKLLEPELAGFLARRAAVDEVYLALVAELDDKRFAETITYTTPKGDKVDRLLWQQLLHLFNHQTHHRGQISQLLDESKVEHDFSGIAFVLG